MGTSARTEIWLDPESTYEGAVYRDFAVLYAGRLSDVFTPDLTFRPAGGTRDLSDAITAIDNLIEALQGLRTDCLARLAGHPQGDGARVPRRAIDTAAAMRTHLVTDHGLAVTDELTEATGLALDARHKREHGSTPTYAARMARELPGI